MIRKSIALNIGKNHVAPCTCVHADRQVLRAPNASAGGFCVWACGRVVATSQAHAIGAPQSRPAASHPGRVAVKPVREGLQMLPGKVVKRPGSGLNRGLLGTLGASREKGDGRLTAHPLAYLS